MKFFSQKLVDLLVSGIAVTGIRCIHPPMLSSFIQNNIEKNGNFLHFRNQYWNQVSYALNEGINSNLISPDRMFILENHRNEIVDVVIIDFYNRSCNPLGIFFEQSDLSENFTSLSIRLSAVALFWIPIEAVKFFCCRYLKVQRAELNEFSRIEELKDIPSLINVNLSENGLKSIPHFNDSSIRSLDLSNNPIEINSPDEIENDGSTVFLYLQGVSIEKIGVFIPLLKRRYKCVETNESPFNFIDRKLYKPSRTKISRNEKFSNYNLNVRKYLSPTKEAFLMFSKMYGGAVYENLKNLLGLNSKMELSDERKKILETNIGRIFLLAAAHYYSSMYVTWWRRFESNPYIRRLIIEDIQNYDFVNINVLRLDNTGCNFLDVEALKFYDLRVIYMMNGQIETEDDVLNLEKVAMELKNLHIFMLEYNCIPRIPKFNESSVCKVSFTGNRCPMAIPESLGCFNEDIKIILNDVPGIDQTYINILTDVFGTVEALGEVHVRPELKSIMDINFTVRSLNTGIPIRMINYITESRYNRSN